MPTIIRELRTFGDRAVLLRFPWGDHYVVSSIDAAFDHGDREAMAFRTDAQGEPYSMHDVAGGRGYTMRECIEELVRVLA